MSAKNPALAREGFRCFAGPYTASEEWMMVNVLADAKAANKETRISHTSSGAWVWQRSKNTGR